MLICFTAICKTRMRVQIIIIKKKKVTNVTKCPIEMSVPTTSLDWTIE